MSLDHRDTSTSDTYSRVAAYSRVDGGIRTSRSPAEVAPTGTSLRDASPAPGPSPTGIYSRCGKRALDLAITPILIVLFLPVMVIIVLACWVAQGRPAIYTQPRVGKDGRAFTLYKFRTMKSDRRSSASANKSANRYDGPDRRTRHKGPDDPRVTRLGRFLRKWSLDELPQLFNVLKGTMSLVGPRPELVDIVAGYEHWQHRRHVVRPGLTGLWQISARDGALMHEVTHIDIAYVDDISFLGDLKILLVTPLAALGRRGAV